MIKIVLILILLIIGIIDIVAVMSNKKIRCIDCEFFLNCENAEEEKYECEGYKKRWQNKNIEKWRED